MDNKGSALIIVLIIMTFVVILGTSLINVTYSEKLMSKSYHGSETAYYIAEAGIERSVSIIEKAVKERINNILDDARAISESYVVAHTEEETDAYLTSYIKSEVNKSIQNFFTASGGGSFSESIQVYQKTPDGKDTVEFPKKDDKISFYNVTASLDASDTDNRTVILTSTGNYGSAVRAITAKYFIQDTEEITVKTTSSSYPDLDIFLNNTVNSIGSTAVYEISNHTTIEGDVLIINKNVDFQSTVTR